MLILRALERGLTLSDFENMTLGMIMDLIITYKNEHLSDDEREDETVWANQKDFDAF